MPDEDAQIPDDRLQRALLAYVRQEFGAPVAAVLGYAELLLDDASRLGLDDMAEDLRRIHTAGLQLKEIVGGLLDPEVTACRVAGQDFAAFRNKLRHDLRTPINAIKGYGEMLAEDAADGAGAALLPDLGKLLDAADGLLGQIDSLVEFSHGEGAADAEATAPGRPAMDAAAMRAALKTISPLSPRAGAEEVAPARILVVDDTAANRDLLSRRLARDGHHVTTAENGTAALALLGETEFDLVLLDLMMPDISGYEVLGRIKGDPQWRHIPVIMISALDEIDAVVRCIEAGAEDFLSKPFNPVLLQARIDASLEKKRLRDREHAFIAELRAEKERSEALLLNILPRPIVERLQRGETAIADRFRDVTILFSDLVGFTPLSARLSPGALLEILNSMFSRFDELSMEHRVEKIKTIGDAYMVAAGLPEPREDHAHAIARMALAMQGIVAETGRRYGEDLKIRIGVHSGAVVAGIIGTHKFIYDVWGDTVNTASRMESHGVPSEIQCSAATYRHLADAFLLEPRGTLQIKGKGAMEIYFLRGERPAPAGTSPGDHGRRDC